MNSLPTINAVLDPLAGCLTPSVAKQIVEVRIDQTTGSRLEELREKANEGTLSEEERAEYEEFVEANDLLILLKGVARSVLKGNG